MSLDPTHPPTPARRHRWLQRLGILVAGACFCGPAIADDEDIQHVVLSDGQVLTAAAVSSTPDGVNIVLMNGDSLTLPLDVVVAIDSGSGTAGSDEPVPPDANKGRYFYGPSAFSLGKGNGYFAQRALLLSSAGVGITDNWDVEVGWLLPTLFIPDVGLGFVGTKVSVSAGERLRLMTGGQVFYVGDGGALGLAFLGATVGDEDRHTSVTTGPATTMARSSQPRRGAEPSRSFFELASWITSISHVKRLGPRAALVSENWLLYLPEGGPWAQLPLFVVPSAGVRLLNQRHAIDLGIIGLIATDSDLPLIPLPWVSFDWTF